MKISDGAISAGAPAHGAEFPSYVLITPARNEAAYLELTIKSVVAQAILPLKWVIVSDGSTDGTDDIVKRYAAEHDWIELVRMPERQERHFAGKVIAFNAGFERVKELRYEVIGNIDGDISFKPDFFQELLGRFRRDPALGVAGAVCIEDGTEGYDFTITNVKDISGACQLFRRDCYDDIGGYVPIKGGGIDSLAVYTARMRGWETRTFTDQSFFHHRKRMGAQGSRLQGLVRAGKRDYNLGNHPLWHALKAVYFMKKRPYLIGGLCLFYGFLIEMLRGAERPVPPELVEFLRKEQMQRLKSILKRKLSPLAQPSGTQ